DPRHREVRCVVARTKPGRRQDAADERAVVVDPGPVRHVALHARASVLYRVGSLAETIETLVRRRDPGRTDSEHLLEGPGRRLDLDDALSIRPDAQYEGATPRIARLQHHLYTTGLAGQRGDGRRMNPAGLRAHRQRRWTRGASGQRGREHGPV